MNQELIRRVRRWDNESKENPGPFKIQINPTNRCNLKCRFCWQRTNEEINYNEIRDKRYLQLVEEAIALDVKEIEITGGGEPLLRKELVLELIGKSKDAGLNVKLITNGTNLEKEDLKEMIGSGLDEVIFSVDGKKETHEFLRQKEGCFDDTLSSVASLRDLKGKKGSDKPKMTIHMVLCKKNIGEVGDMVELDDEYGCENFFVEPVVTLAFDTDMGKKLAMDDSEIARALKETRSSIKKAERRDINHNLGSLEEELISKTNEMDEVIEKDFEESSSQEGGIKGSACFEPWHNLVIRPEGTVGPCCMFDNQGPNIRNGSLEEIWFGDYFQRIRDRLRINDLLSFCSKCNPSQVSNNRKIREDLKDGLE